MTTIVLLTILALSTFPTLLPSFLELGGATLDPSILRHALSTIFPTVVTCYMPLFGVTGEFTTVSGMCVLPLNIVHEKIFLVLWFWLVGLALVALVQLARQTALLSSTLRPYLAPSLSSEAQVSTPTSSSTLHLQARRLVTCGSYGDTVLPVPRLYTYLFFEDLGRQVTWCVAVC